MMDELDYLVLRDDAVLGFLRAGVVILLEGRSFRGLLGLCFWWGILSSFLCDLSSWVLVFVEFVW